MVSVKHIAVSLVDHGDRDGCGVVAHGFVAFALIPDRGHHYRYRFSVDTPRIGTAPGRHIARGVANGGLPIRCSIQGINNSNFVPVEAGSAPSWRETL